MINSEFRASLQGCLHLLRADPAALNFFNLTIDGFWRSFYCVLIAFPFELTLTLTQTDRLIEAPSTLGFVAKEFFGYSIGWVLFPIIALATTRFFNLESRYVIYVITANYVRLVQIVVLSLMLTLLGLDVIASVFGLMIIVATLIYDWLATKIALDTSASIATGLVLINALIVLLVQRTIIELL